MTLRLAGKVAIVTGGADGIGRGIAKMFAEQGANVCVADVNEELGATVHEEAKDAAGEIFFHQTDISSPESVKAMVEATVAAYGPVTVLVNNAAIISLNENMLDTELDYWRKVLSVNLEGAWLCAQTVIPYMKEAGGGSIINLGSVHSFKIIRNYFPYAVTKHGLIGLTRTIAVEFGDDNIRCNALCPGMVETPAAFRAFDAAEDPVAARVDLGNLHPLRRNGSVEEIAYPAVFLASEESAFMTGQEMIVDGGRSAVYHD